jgi:hypothetical protein
MKHFKNRHYNVGPSSRRPRETYRIDHTSIDGSGLTRDDGNQQAEPQLDDFVATIANADMRNQRGR